MEQFYTGWVRMTAHPKDNLYVTKEKKFFNHGDKDSRFAVRNFVHKHLCEGNLVITTPVSGPDDEEIFFKEETKPCKGEVVKHLCEGNLVITTPVSGPDDEEIFFKEETKPCKGEVVKHFTFSIQGGRTTIKDNFGNYTILDKEQSDKFLDELEDIEGIACDSHEELQMTQELLAKYEPFMDLSVED